MQRHTQMGGRHGMDWCRGEYTSGTILRIFLLILLWLLYALIPHKLPLSWLHLVGVILAAYDIWLFKRRNALTAWLILLAIALNELLVLYLHPGFNLFVTILITAILLWDIMTAPKLDE